MKSSPPTSPTLLSSPVPPSPLPSPPPPARESTKASEYSTKEIMSTIETNSSFPYQVVGQPGMMYGSHFDPMMTTPINAFNMGGFVPQQFAMFQLQNPLTLSPTNPAFNLNEFPEINEFPLNQNDVEEIKMNPYSFNALLHGLEGPKDIEKIMKGGKIQDIPIARNQGELLAKRINELQKKNGHGIPHKKAKQSYFQWNASVAALYRKGLPLRKILKKHKKKLKQMQVSFTELKEN